MSKLNLEDIKFLAFQGGGGKGSAYAGGIRALEDPELGIDKMDDEGNIYKQTLLPCRPESPIEGIGGTSAGSITALILGMGMDASDIDDLISNKAFDKFFDQPLPGITRAVKYVNGRNLPGYVVADVEIRFIKGKKAAKKGKKRKLVPVLKKHEYGKFYRSLPMAQTAAKVVEAKYAALLSFVGLTPTVYDTVSRLLGGKGITFKTADLDAMKRAFVSKSNGAPAPGNINKFLQSLLYDRGLFTGIAPRALFQQLIFKHLGKNFPKGMKKWRIANGFKALNDVDHADIVAVGEVIEDLQLQGLVPNLSELRLTDFTQIVQNIPGALATLPVLDKKTVALIVAFMLRMHRLTFQEHHEITGKQLVMIGANSSKPAARHFSKRLTPDFPIADATALSMSIPGAFKPAFVDAVVDISKAGKKKSGETLEKYRDRKAFIASYQGLYMDGGMVENLPLHVFDYEDFPQLRDKRVVDVNAHVLAIGLDPGPDPLDTKFFSNSLYQSYLAARKQKDYADDPEGWEVLQKEYANTVQQHQKNVLALSNTGDVYEPFLATFQPEKTKYGNNFALLGKLFGETLNGILTGGRESLLRVQQERDQYIKMYPYDIGTLDFSANEDLVAFIQGRAEDKVREYFGFERKNLGD